MAYEVNGCTLRTLYVIELHIERQGYTVTEARGKVVAHHIVSLLYSLSVALARERVMTELRALTLENISHIYAEAESTVIEKGNAEIAVSRLALLLLVLANARTLRHILYGKARNKTKLLNTVSDLLYFMFH